MKTLLLCACLMIAVGCKKKNDAVTTTGSATATTTTATTAAKTAPADKVELPKAGVVPECDAAAATWTKVAACATIKEEDRAVQQVNVSQLKGIVEAYMSAPADQKDTMKTATVTQCKDQDDKLKKLLADAGC